MSPNYQITLPSSVVRSAYLKFDGRIVAMTGKAVIAEVMVIPYRIGNREKIAKFKQF